MAAPSQETVVAGPPSNLAPYQGKVRPAQLAWGGKVLWRKARLTRTVINMIMSGRPANRERADPPPPNPRLLCKGDSGHDDTRNVGCVVGPCPDVTEVLAQPSRQQKMIFIFSKRQKNHTKNGNFPFMGAFKSSRIKFKKYTSLHFLVRSVDTDDHPSYGQAPLPLDATYYQRLKLSRRESYTIRCFRIIIDDTSP